MANDFVDIQCSDVRSVGRQETGESDAPGRTKRRAGRGAAGRGARHPTGARLDYVETDITYLMPTDAKPVIQMPALGDGGSQRVDGYGPRRVRVYETLRMRSARPAGPGTRPRAECGHRLVRRGRGQARLLSRARAPRRGAYGSQSDRHLRSHLARSPGCASSPADKASQLRVAVRAAHNDYTDAWPRRVRDLLPDEAEDLLAPLRDRQRLAADQRRSRDAALGGRGCRKRLAGRYRPAPGLPRPRRRGPGRVPQPGASLVLLPGDGGRRGDPPQMLRFRTDGRALPPRTPRSTIRPARPTPARVDIDARAFCFWLPG